MNYMYKIIKSVILFTALCYLMTPLPALNYVNLSDNSSCKASDYERMIEKCLGSSNSNNNTEMKFEAMQNKIENFVVPKNVDNSSNILQICIPIKDNNTNDNTLLSTIIGGLLAVFGGFLVAFWNSRNESKRMKFEWGKFLFEKYEKNYRDFIKDLDDISSVTQLERNYRQLLASSFIPLSLKSQTENAIKLLKDESLSDEEKNSIRENLVNSYAKLIQEPWGFT